MVSNLSQHCVFLTNISLIHIIDGMRNYFRHLVYNSKKTVSNKKKQVSTLCYSRAISTLPKQLCMNTVNQPFIREIS